MNTLINVCKNVIFGGKGFGHQEFETTVKLYGFFKNKEEVMTF